MIVRIHPSDRETIREHARQAYPVECCGFLIGNLEKDQKLVRQVRLADNRRADTNNRYLIDPETLHSVEESLRGCPFELIGFFHSHPDVPAEPSPYDLEHAWPWYSYLIVSVVEGYASDLTSWHLRNDRSAFNPETILEFP